MTFAGNRNVSFSRDTISGVMGDFMTLWADSHNNLNYGVRVTNNTMTHSGYHGITVEGAVGLLVDGNTISGVGNGGVDLEYDDFPTVYKPGPLGPCRLASCPTGGAEIDVTFRKNHWSDIGGIWIESLQGQKVTENNLRLISNTVTGKSSVSVLDQGQRDAPQSRVHDARQRRHGWLLLAGRGNQRPPLGVGTRIVELRERRRRPEQQGGLLQRLRGAGGVLSEHRPTSRATPGTG